MTDLEMTRLCAFAMGYEEIEDQQKVSALSYRSDTEINTDRVYHFDPIRCDAQAMALVKKIGIRIEKKDNMWMSSDVTSTIGEIYKTLTSHADLNRAIVECVAKMKKQ